MSTQDVETQRLNYTEAVELALREEMRADETVFTMGTSVQAGGFFGRKGEQSLCEEFGPKRVRNTGILEVFMTGAAAGAAIVGMKPVVQLGFGGFALIAGDEIYHKLAKWRYMHGGKFPMSAVIRLSIGHADAAGPEHSNSYELLGMHLPGLKVVVPATAADAYGLMRTAIRDPDPVLFHEVRSLRFLRGQVPTDPDFAVPLGRAAIAREGETVTVVTYGQMLHDSLRAAELVAQDGISAEVIDLRTLLPLDYETVYASVGKTRRALVVNEAHLNAGPASEIATRIYEHDFARLAAPVRRLCALDVPAPQTRRLEAMVRPSVEQIAGAMRELAEA
jgi:acetoin:2,6-dichlorophenolindophenol oxidoreductase subunit beta